ncbi:MAG: NrfD/PsrC family molybdoenzyme membrane anchor subunit [Eubacteriales bacterium]
MGGNSEVVLNTKVGINTNKTFLGVMGILFILGFGFWIKQITCGFSGYSAQYAWGLYIAAFFTAVAGGAGAMILASITTVVKVMDEKKSRQFYTAAIAMFVMAGFFILADLGSPLNIFKLIFTTNASAPMVFDFWLLMICVVICLLMVFLKGNVKVLSLIGLACAIALLMVESWLVASSNVQQLWGITMGAGTAFIQVAIMAFALLLLIGQEDKYVKYGLMITLIMFLVVSLTDLVSGISDIGHLGLQWSTVSGSGLFWIGVIFGVVAPLFMLFKIKNIGSFHIIILSVLSMLGVLFTKLSYVWSSQAIPAIDTGILTKPSLHLEEVIIVIGFTALGSIIYTGLNALKGGA